MLPLSNSDIGQGYNGPKTGDQDQGIEPWTHKKIMLQGRGCKPWTYQKDIRSCAWSCIQSCIESRLLACVQRTQKMHRMCKQLPHGTCPLDDGRRPARGMMARPSKKRTMQTVRKVMNQSRKICSLQNRSFLGTSSCTNLCRLLKVDSAYCKTPVEYILQKYSSCTFTW